MITALKTRILRLLAQGLAPSVVASAVGCEPSYISQLLADPVFENELKDLKYSILTEATDRDDKINKLEDKMIDRIASDVEHNPVAFRNTMERVRALSLVNALKRRGAGADINSSGQTINNIVTLVLPTQVVSRYCQYEKDINNQVIKTGDQNLITMQAGQLKSFIEHIGNNDEHDNQSGSSYRNKLLEQFS